MTLKEKFKKIEIKLGENNTTNLVDVEAKECEQIADDFAIGFAEWYRKISPIMDKKYIGKNSKELLEIYKKEKGL